MDIAKCTLDNHIYSAVDFSNFTGRELSNKRQNIVCTECGKQAFFRKASRSGQAACFGARPHEDFCKFASPETQRDKREGGDEELRRNPGRLIEIDLNYGAAPGTNINIVRDPDDHNPEGQGRHVRGRQPRRANMHRRLSTLLKNLVASEEFQQSQQFIQLGDSEPTTVANFFVPFEEAADDYDGTFSGYWGMITDAGWGKDGGLWLNSGGVGEVSCLVKPEHVDQFMQRYNLEDEEQLSEGAYLLILGTKETSWNGKPHIIADDLSMVALLP